MGRRAKNDNTRRVKGEGTIRKKGNGYEGRITVEVNGVRKLKYGETVDINGKVVGTYNKAVDAGKKAADMGQDVIDRLKETEAYETIRSKGQEAYTEFTAEGGKAEKFNEWAQEKSAKIDEFVGDVSDRIKSEIDRFDDSKLKDVFDDIKKYTDDLLKKKEGSEESVSDVDASCDIDDVIDEIDAEESEDK